MLNAEKNCKWTFDPQTGREDGPNDALGQSFKQRPYASLVRESIQNSLDVAISTDMPVKVKFSFGEIKSNRFSNFFEVKNHIQGCIDYFHSNPTALSKYGAMRACFDNSYIETMPYIKVSDYNTKGMMYKRNNNNLPFYAFVRAASISVKNEGSTGGTYGFGKAAYFQISPINTILVSTQTDDGNNFFEGASVLCTHTYNGKLLTSVGFYDNNGGYPIEDIEQIPKKFRRTEPGTDFYILGFDFNAADEAINEMIEEVLRSFCIAIVKRRLVVEIVRLDGQIISIDNHSVKDYLSDVFPNPLDKSGQSRSLNPRPYFDAVINQNTSKKFKHFSKVYPLLGKLELYVKTDKNAADKIIYMRRPLMYVASRKTSSNIGFYGVLVCRDIQGDKLLSKLENASHSEWKKENYRDDVYNRIVPEGAEAISEINDFLQDCIDKIAGTDNKTALDVTSLGDYLYVPDNLIDDEEEISATVLGAPTGNYQDESGSITTDTRTVEINPNDRNATNLGSVLVPERKSFITGDGNDSGGTGHKKNHKSKEKGGQPPVGITPQQGSLVDDGGVHKSILHMPVRTLAQNENGAIYHYVLIHSDRDVDNAIIELTVCGEQIDEKLEIQSTSIGQCNGNEISGLKLNTGLNKIKIQFKDKMMHSLKTRLYNED